MSASGNEGPNCRLTPRKTTAKLRIADRFVGSGNRGIASPAEFWGRSKAAELE